MNFSRFHHENRKNREYLFNPCYLCSQNAPISSLHSLSIRLFRKHCKLTIFNPFNFMAREFSVESFRMEIFRVFEGLVTSCLTTNCKYIEDQPEKDGIFFQWNLFCLSEDGVSVENKPETGGKFRRLACFAFLLHYLRNNDMRIVFW